MLGSAYFCCCGKTSGNGNSDGGGAGGGGSYGERGRRGVSIYYATATYVTRACDVYWDRLTCACLCCGLCSRAHDHAAALDTAAARPRRLRSLYGEHRPRPRAGAPGCRRGRGRERQLRAIPSLNSPPTTDAAFGVACGAV
eukprot:SAG11_NODE_427_length_9558_cov_4.909398_3_plen_141_part_00